MNVVFDLGGVVVTWDPIAVIRSVFDDPGDQALVTSRVLRNPDWVELDRGTLTLAAAVERAAQRTGISAERMHPLFEAAVRSLVPKPDTLELIGAVRAAGHSLLVLSNMDRRALAHLEATYDIFDLFNGRIVSCEVGACKPEPAIYRHLLETFQLDPSATVFIDDLQVNLDAAAAHGMRTIRYEGAESCRASLRQLGYLNT
jgi:putative hydrolase of the HAD superfamily